MITILKLGGSLLELADLRHRLQRLVHYEAIAGRVLILVGGGKIVEAVRVYDQVHQLSNVQTHWLCVELMNQTAQLLAAILVDYPLVSRVSQLQQWLEGGSSRMAIVSPSAFYSPALNVNQLPENWDTTSDSISVLLASKTKATELILLKSTETGAQQEPLLDGEFQLQVEKFGINWRIVNLRDPKYA